MWFLQLEHGQAQDKMLKIFDDKKKRIFPHYASRKCRAAGFILALTSATTVQALEFGAMQAVSGLGQPLHATVAIIGARASVQMGTCFTSHVTSTTGTPMAAVEITIMSAYNGALLRLSTSERIAEPAVTLVVESHCGYNIRREFALLLDPPNSQLSVPAGMTLTISTLALPGPTPTTRRGPREEDRLRRFIAARQAKQASLPTNAPIRQNALYLTTPIAASITSRLERPRETGAGNVQTVQTNQAPQMTNLRLTLADRIMVRNLPPLAITQAQLQPPQPASAITIGRTEKRNRKILTFLGGVLVLGLGLIIYLRTRPVFRKQPPLDWRWEEDEKIASVTTASATPTTPAALPAAIPVSASVSASVSVAIPPALMLDPMVIGPIHRYDSAPVYSPPMIVMPDAFSSMKSKATPKLSVPEDLQFPELPVTPNALEAISDVMEEAEFWISLKDPQRAVQVLEPYASANQSGGPLPWLYLFDLYLEMANRSKYDALRESFHHIFNARILTWDDQIRADSTLQEHSIEDVPHLQAKITSMWHGKEIIVYLEGLLIDDRYGTRAGFSLPVFHEIMFLIALARAIHAEEGIEKSVPEAYSWTIAG